MVGGCDFISPKKLRIAKKQSEVLRKLESDLVEDFNIKKIETHGLNEFPVTDSLGYKSLSFWLSDNSFELNDSIKMRILAENIGDYTIDRLSGEIECKVVTLLFLDSNNSRFNIFENSQKYYFDTAKPKGQRIISSKEANSIMFD
jgi:hypothetical protein